MSPHPHDSTTEFVLYLLRDMAKFGCLIGLFLLLELTPVFIGVEVFGTQPPIIAVLAAVGSTAFAMVGTLAVLDLYWRVSD